MNNTFKKEKLVRDYLLGRLSETESESIEKRVMTDREFSDFVLVVESVLVEDYIEGRLQGRDRESFERLFLATPQGSDQILFARALKEYALKARPSVLETRPQQRSWRSAFVAPRWAAASVVILLIVMGVVIWRVFFVESEIDKGLLALGKAYKERPIDARITILEYMPRTRLRSETGEKVDYVKLKQAENILEDQSRENPGSPSYHALGRLYLIQKDFPRAIDYLKKALEFEPADAQVHSDLGAAFMEKGKAVNAEGVAHAMEDFSESRRHLDKAIELDPSLLAALFNRALLYQELSLTPQAKDDWQQYLKRDSNSPWAVEAIRYIESIENQRK